MTTLSKPAHPGHKPCRVCRKRLTPAERGRKYGMPCRPCLIGIFDAMHQDRVAQEAATPPVTVSAGYHYR